MITCQELESYYVLVLCIYFDFILVYVACSHVLKVVTLNENSRNLKYFIITFHFNNNLGTRNLKLISSWTFYICEDFLISIYLLIKGISILFIFVSVELFDMCCWLNYIPKEKNNKKSFYGLTRGWFYFPTLQVNFTYVLKLDIIGFNVKVMLKLIIYGFLYLSPDNISMVYLSFTLQFCAYQIIWKPLVCKLGQTVKSWEVHRFNIIKCVNDVSIL